MTIQQFRDPLADHLIGEFSAEAEVELHKQLAGDHIVAAGTRLDIRNLHAGGREELIPPIPLRRDQLRQRRHRPVNRIIRQMRIGDVALHTVHRQIGGNRAASAILYHVTDDFRAGRFADQAIVQAFATRHQPFNHFNRAVGTTGLFIRGNHKGEAAPMIGTHRHKTFGGHHHGRQ